MGAITLYPFLVFTSSSFLCTWSLPIVMPMTSRVQILCFKFSLNHLRFSPTRENDYSTKLSKVKNNCRNNHLAKLVFWSISSFKFQFEVFQIAQLLALVIFVLVSLMGENLRGLRENLKHKIWSIDEDEPKESLWIKESLAMATICNILVVMNRNELNLYGVSRLASRTSNEIPQKRCQMIFRQSNVAYSRSLCLHLSGKIMPFVFL